MKPRKRCMNALRHSAQIGLKMQINPTLSTESKHIHGQLWTKEIRIKHLCCIFSL